MIDELNYIKVLIDDLEESTDKCDIGIIGNISIYEEIDLLKRIYFKLSKPNVQREIIEQVINQNGNKLNLKEIIKSIKKDEEIRIFLKKIKKMSKRINELEQKISSENDHLKKIEKSNKLMMEEINGIDSELEESKAKIKKKLKMIFEG